MQLGQLSMPPLRTIVTPLSLSSVLPNAVHYQNKIKNEKEYFAELTEDKICVIQSIHFNEMYQTCLLEFASIVWSSHLIKHIYAHERIQNHFKITPISHPSHSEQLLS